MNKTIITSALALMLSFSTFASDFRLPARDVERINTEVQQMTKVLNLSNSDAQKIKNLKMELTSGSKEAAKKYGRNTPEFKAAREPLWTKYRESLLSTITEKELKQYNAWAKNNK
ncbi:hypothetical protein [Photobacterium lutimaris]|uniref:Uncharacterized protein n=1 Tax=Photobacterium lutimaris TaxID=388278 RepID=A0A2T3IYY6_9GAMM|nr:hypothetical protein [Photobacterium lutimaris]PSU33854.1 hypothetical protein C9I99_10805 [Photobacterium lutimaris]TDR76179.1 hypothetical protein DFP78_103174 [Photobacterium lutimaris]